MRVKIDGAITVERLKGALELATKHFEEVFGDEFAGFFGANLYIRAFRKDGEEIGIFVNGKEKVVTLPRLPGVPEKPGLSDDALAQRAARAAQQEEAERASEKRQREADERYRAQQAQYSQQVAALQAHIKTFQAIAATFGEELIRDCNAAINAVWDERKPVWPNGQKKGQPRAMPYLAVAEGTVLLFTGNRPGDSQKIRTPLVKRLTVSGSEPYWRYTEWQDVVVPALAAVIDRYSKNLQPAVDPQDSQEASHG